MRFIAKKYLCAELRIMRFETFTILVMLICDVFVHVVRLLETFQNIDFCRVSYYYLVGHES